MKPFIIMSGQISTMIQLSTSLDWGFTKHPREASSVPNGFRLEGMPYDWMGGIYYAADANSERAKRTLEVLSDLPCWPNPKALLKMVDRNEVAEECFRQGFYGSDPCEVTDWRRETVLTDTVLKVGNEHSGEGKILIPAGADLPHWLGKATIQPFFKGRSVRVLHLDTALYFIETVHPASWIKNSPGGENVLFDARNVPSSMLEHSYKVRDHFGLEVCGNDYVLSDDGSFHFLETNQFPGIEVDLLGDLPRNYFLERMRSLEKIVAC